MSTSPAPAEAELPLDINYQKLTEWLVARQKLPADWHKRLQAIQGKMAQAVKELPAGLLAQVAGSGEAPVDYFRAVAIRDKLAQSGERSLFGGLTGQAGIWDKIVKAYENGGVFIGEAAQTLVQHVDYELPYLRKQMAKCSQGMADAERRHGEYVRSAASCAANYRQECERLGISGSTAVSKELAALTRQLPGLFEALVADLRSEAMAPAIAYYQHFTHYAHGSGGPAAAGAAASEQQQLPDVLPVLNEVRQGATALWTGHAADSAANNAAAGADGGADDGAGGIQWDMSDLTAAAEPAADAAGGAGAAISWDFVVEEPAASTGDDDDAAAAAGSAAAGAGGPSLDWDIDLSGIDVEGAGQDDAAAAAAAGGGINWDVDVGGGDAGQQQEQAAAAHDSSSSSSSGDASAVRLQHDSEYRAQLVDDLQELRAFLLSRQAGLSSGGSSGALLTSLAPEVVASTDAKRVSAMLQLVEACLAQLNAEQLRQLLMIASSARYVERLSSSLVRKAGQESKMLAAAAETQAKQQDARATLAALQPKVSEIVARMRTIKAAVEAAVSKQFNGRRVNVLGEINSALSAAAAPTTTT